MKYLGRQDMRGGVTKLGMTKKPKSFAKICYLFVIFYYFFCFLVTLPIILSMISLHRVKQTVTP